MKTSNILLILIFSVVLIGLTAFNLKLKCAYNKGDYKSAYYGMSFSPVSGITQLHVEGANKIELILKQGDEEGIWMKDKVKNNIEWNQEGAGLTIGLTNAVKEEAVDMFYEQVFLILKDLEKVNTSVYLHEGESPYAQSQMILEGFKLDKLDLSISTGTRLIMDSISIDTLSAIIGQKEVGYAGLVLGSGSQIKAASFEVPGGGELTLADPTIQRIHYRLSDQAHLNLKGRLLEKLNNE